MILILIFVNAVGLIYFLYRREYTFFFYMLLHFPLVTFQALYFFFNKDETVFGLHHVDERYFDVAIFFVVMKLATIIGLRLLAPRKLYVDPLGKSVTVFNLTSSFVMLCLILGVGLYFVFGFLGLSDFLYASRPAVKGGSMIFIIILFVMLYPSVNNYFVPCAFNIFNFISVVFVVVVFAQVSKMHALSILLALIILKLARDRSGVSLKVFLVLFLIIAIFVYLQISRDTSEVDYFASTQLLLKLLYEFGNESFLGLYSSIGKMADIDGAFEVNYGVFMLIDGVQKLIPEVIRPSVFADLQHIDPSSINRQSIVASLDEEFFRAFQLLGSIIEGILLYLLISIVDKNFRILKVTPFVFSVLVLLPFLIRGPSLVVINHMLFLVPTGLFIKQLFGQKVRP